MKRRSLTVLCSAAAAAALAVVVLAGLAGALTVVITHGDSMEPTYHAGDVVVVAHTDTYAVGDIAAYRSPLLDQVVLHRIVGGQADGFVLSGDNNDWLDPERPPADELVGVAWLHLPKLGIPARWLKAHAPLAAAGVFVLLAGTGAAAGRTRRNRSMKKHAKHHQGAPAAGHHQLAAGLLVGLLGFGLLAGVAWARPTTTAGPVGYTHEAAFTYTASASTGPVYDSPRVRTGQPLFLALVDDVRVGLSYRFDAEEPATMRGTIGLHATVDNATGWSRTLELAEPRPFDGDKAEIAGDLDIAKIRATVAEAAEATGETGATTITLEPQITVAGDVAGQPLQERFAPSLAYQLTDTQLRPPQATEDEDDAPLVERRRGELRVPDRQPAVLSWAGRAIDVATARMLSLAAAAVCAVGLVVLTVTSRRSGKLSESERSRRRWPDLIVTADVEDTLPLRVVTVADMSALVALARRSDRLILHDRATDAFLLDLDGTHYRYKAAAPATQAAVPVVPPAPAATPPDTRPCSAAGQRA